MRRRFEKYHGCGNSYLYFDCFREPLLRPEMLAVKLSDPRKGIGSDGIILICPSDKGDAFMDIYNADGSRGKMCGNGIRCVGKYLADSGRVTGETCVIDTLSGLKTLRLLREGGVCVGAEADMGPASFAPESLPCTLWEGESLAAAGETLAGVQVSMGNPHFVVFCDDPEGVDLPRVGGAVEHHTAFPEGVNTEFVRAAPEGLTMRVWERGSGETWACGTGACAAAAAAVKTGRWPMGERVPVFLRGGTLWITVTPDTVRMKGEAVWICGGEVEV